MSLDPRTAQDVISLLRRIGQKIDEQLTAAQAMLAEAQAVLTAAEQLTRSTTDTNHAPNQTPQS